MKKILSFVFFSCLFAFIGRINAQEKAIKKETLSQNEFTTHVTAIGKDPANLELHAGFIKDLGLDDPRLEKQYQAWVKKYPKIAEIPYAIGHAYASKESPKATTWLLQSVKVNPDFAKAYFDLWLDTERRGDFEKARAYIGKASEVAPDDPNYSFYYASSFSQTDKKKYEELSVAVAKKFPDHERGAQALYWLGHRLPDSAARIRYLEMLRHSYAPEKFSWSSSGMSGYFDLLLTSDPSAAAGLAEEMVKRMQANEAGKKSWEVNLANALAFARAKESLASGDGNKAFAALAEVKLNRWARSNNALLLAKAEALAVAGNSERAYEELKIAYAKNPEGSWEDALYKYGSNIGKSSVQVKQEIWQVRDTAAKIATAFSLKKYIGEGNLSTEDLKGKVTLVTYWFPGCGPCRGEFPHFENVVRKFKDADFEYVGINIVPEQNDYVVPFMKSSGYSFIPIEDTPGREKGNLDNRNAAPVNFLLDKKGRIIFSNFRTDEHNEEVLENMIKALLDS